MRIFHKLIKEKKLHKHRNLIETHFRFSKIMIFCFQLKIIVYKIILLYRHVFKYYFQLNIYYKYFIGQYLEIFQFMIIGMSLL